ncbi:MAG TPA: hypothetical protein VGN42_24320 [Pirellulales bacterium]|jgi:hypothetical protein|nr:hypothetical protein [Pirellulales bacterium]
MSFEFKNQFRRDREKHLLPGDALRKRTVAMLNDEKQPADSAEEPEFSSLLVEPCFIRGSNKTNRSTLTIKAQI